MNICVNYDYIESDAQLLEFCDRMRNSLVVGFDTEFVSEDSFEPQLCLVQVAAEGHLAVIDPLAVNDMKPFWKQIAEPGHVTVVHAGREEFRFCRRAIGRRPHQLFDLQIAAGMIGLEYPAAYSKLIQKLLNKTLAKGETRTDWRRRPLSDQQINYAIDDVVHLEPMLNELHTRLQQLGRLEWLDVEIENWQRHIESYDQQEHWRRVSGLAGLSQHSLAIVRELWHWRQEEARRRDMPAKRVLRDDLIVELARRQTDDVKRIQVLRGMQHRELQRQLPQLAATIRRANNLSASDLPSKNKRRFTQKKLTTLGQFLHTALNSICRSANIAPGIVGTVQDVHDLIAYNLEREGASEKPPLLTQGWREEIVGKQLEDLMSGRTVIRVKNPTDENPLVFEERQE